MGFGARRSAQGALEPVSTLGMQLSVMEPLTPPKVLVVILSFNDWGQTIECLDSFSRVAYPNYEIILVDNASSNPPIEAVLAKYPGVTCLRNDRNLGYAAGNNVGVRYALERGASYAMVLNNDTLTSPDCLTRLVEAGESHPDAAFMGPLVYHQDEPRVIQSAGGFMTSQWQSYHRGQNETDEGQYEDTEAVTWVTGCCIMARCSLLEKIGLMDPDFFIYSEEVDWCLRAGQAGMTVLFVPKAKIWHKGVKRNYDPSPRVTYLSARNELHLLVKHHAGVTPLAMALLRHIRTLTSWSVRPRWRGRRAHRNALAYAIRDFALGRYGAPPLAF